LADDSTLPPPEAREEALYRRLQELDLRWKTISHRPVFTVADSADVYAILDGFHTKNLFLRDAKGGLWLVLARAHLRIDLNALARQLGAPRFSFGSAELLIETLGIAPGAVNPFALMNDTAGKVTAILDAAMAADGAAAVNFHPMRNDRTTAIAAADLVTFLRAAGHEPRVVALPEK
jgi:Ala-tRNA(Pro) deacylase